MSKPEIFNYYNGRENFEYIPLDDYQSLEAENVELKRKLKEAHFELEAFGGWLLETRCPTSVLAKFRDAMKPLSKLATIEAQEKV